MRPGEGFFTCQSRSNDKGDAFGVLQYVIVPKPQRPETIRCEPSISRRIPCGIRMLAAIRFDDEPGLEAEEIRDIRPDWHLPPEFRPRKLAVAQDAPQPVFGIGHGVAKAARPA